MACGASDSTAGVATTSSTLVSSTAATAGAGTTGSSTAAVVCQFDQDSSQRWKLKKLTNPAFASSTLTSSTAIGARTGASDATTGAPATTGAAARGSFFSFLGLYVLPACSAFARYESEKRGTHERAAPNRADNRRPSLTRSFSFFGLSSDLVASSNLTADASSTGAASTAGVALVSVSLTGASMAAAATGAV